ncbi:MAG: metallophosphoesterase [Candidatus Omnitrophota bacterium]|jgi:hypothetical protein
MVKIGVLADTHIPDRAGSVPKEVLAGLKDVDMIIHAGDLVSLSVLDQLRTVCKNVKAVSGNMDQDEVKRKLPEKEVISVNDFKIGVTHGYGHPNKLLDVLAKIFKNDAVDMVIFGHSHEGFNEKKGNVLYFNPGSATDKIFSAYNSYGIIEIDDKIKARIIKF